MNLYEKTKAIRDSLLKVHINYNTDRLKDSGALDIDYEEVTQECAVKVWEIMEKMRLLREKGGPVPNGVDVSGTDEDPVYEVHLSHSFSAKQSSLCYTNTERGITREFNIHLIGREDDVFMFANDVEKPMALMVMFGNGCVMSNDTLICLKHILNILDGKTSV